MYIKCIFNLWWWANHLGSLAVRLLYITLSCCSCRADRVGAEEGMGPWSALYWKHLRTGAFRKLDKPS